LYSHRGYSNLTTVRRFRAAELLDFHRERCIFLAAIRFAAWELNDIMHTMKGQRHYRLFREILFCFAAAGVLAAASVFAQTYSELPAATNATVSLSMPVSTNAPGWITRPLTMVDALNLTLKQNSAIVKARADLESTRGLVIQTRAVALPSVTASGRYTKEDQGLIQKFPHINATFPDQNWTTGIQIVQNIYQGGRTLSAFRAAKLEKEQSMLQYQTAVADALLAARVAYYDVLVAEQQIKVNEASVALLTQELEDQQRRFDAGTVPKFNVLQAQVAVANARPPLIKSQNAYRVAKNTLASSLGFNLPRSVWEDIPLNLVDKLDANPYSVDLPSAIAQALEKRTELAALQRTVGLQRENIINARSGYKPTLQAFAGYDWNSSEFSSDPSQEFDGWIIGGQLNWNIFDGMLTYGKVVQAKAQLEHAKADVEDRSRQIELEVRTDYSSFIEARETLESQQKVQEEAEEALRLAKARADAGTGTRLDVLNAETQLTQARTTQVQALHDYDVARARFERAIGQDMQPAPEK
jgi:outer membrane protein